MSPAYPSLYQVNTRVLLTALSRTLGRPATLDDIPDAELDRIAGLGFDYVWLLSVRRTGSAGQRVSRAHAGWRHEFEDTLPDLCAEDIAGSGFAITGYTAHPAVGGTAALARTRRRLQARGLKLMLDFVPNHTALDHPWVEDHRDRRAVRRRALRHGDAGSAEDLRTHLASSSTRGPSRPRGLRLRLRQAPLRPAARGTRAARARAPVGGSRLPESARAVHGEPRRAQGRPDVCVGDARGRGTSVSRRTWFALRASPSTASVSSWPSTMPATRASATSVCRSRTSRATRYSSRT